MKRPTKSRDIRAQRKAKELARMFAPAFMGEPVRAIETALAAELPGMWERADFEGGATDAPLPDEEKKPEPKQPKEKSCGS